MQRGKIKALIRDRGFGFIRTEQGEEVFSHRNELQGVGYRSLREGQKVEFEVSQALDGSCAVKVRLAQAKAE
jgi:CspA family cold shock protein